MPLPSVISFIIGSLLFGFFYLMNRKFKIDYVIGVYIISVFIMGFFIMIYYPNETNSFASLGFLIMLILSVFTLLGYVLTWVLVKGILKK